MEDKMTKVVYNDKEIELCDKLEEDQLELDLIDKKKINLEDTLELNKNEVIEKIKSDLDE